MNASQDSRPLLVRCVSAVMVCNPLLLLSPMCLLYGIYRAVTAPNLFATDVGNTIFNFAALTIYTLMVCVTSTLLARKRIMPDTVMLLLLNGVLFVAPFILIAHGVFIEGIAMALGISGIAAGLGQLQILKRRLPESFVSGQLIMGGALILAANFAAPMIFRSGLENNNEAWGATGEFAWNLILPMLVAWMNFLPARNGTGAVWTRGWFALAIYSLWLGGTAMQLWTVAYVDDRHLHASQFTVSFWVLAWTAFRHAHAFPAVCAARLQIIAPCAAILIPALGALAGLNHSIAALLFSLNLPLLLLAYARLPVLALGSVSAVGALCCMPLEWMHFISPQMDRLQFIGMTFAALSLGSMAVLRDARAGLVGAIGIAIAITKFTDFSSTIAVNAAVLFLFLHQLRWPEMKRDQHVLLGLAGAAWILHTLTLEFMGMPDARLACYVATIVATLCLRNASAGLPTSLVPAICSIIILCLHPVHWSAKTAAAAPSGVLPIAAGFLLLGAGAWHSLRRPARQSSVER